jgi:hypothetical protein
MRPGTTEWTCPDCGAEHGGSTMGQLEPDDVEAVTPTGPAVAQAGLAAATTAAVVHARGSRRGGPPSRGRLAAIAMIGVIAVLAVAFALSSLGGGGNGTASTASPTPDAKAALCLHLRDLQTPREDSLTRLADTLQNDATALQGQGQVTLARKVLKLRKAALAYRDALVSQGDLTAVSAQMFKAVNALPC